MFELCREREGSLNSVRFLAFFFVFKFLGLYRRVLERRDNRFNLPIDFQYELYFFGVLFLFSKMVAMVIEIRCSSLYENVK